MQVYHKAVMLEEAVEGLKVQQEGVYVDATFGGGGHSARILDQLGPNGRLFGFDQDSDAEKNALEDRRFVFVASNFSYMPRFLRVHGIREVDGILADLGVSSHQFDVPERGFSFRNDGPLDMRMNQGTEVTAADIIKKYDPGSLQRIFSLFGEVRNAKTLATRIVEYRSKYSIDSISDLLEIVEPIIKGQRQRYLAKVFQALRMEVNGEVEALQQLLENALALLKPGGRLVVLSYHSVEDRIVKHFLKTGNVEGVVEKDFYGHINRPFKILTKKAILPTSEEVKENARARSAKLRIGEKN